MAFESSHGLICPNQPRRFSHSQFLIATTPMTFLSASFVMRSSALGQNDTTALLFPLRLHVFVSSGQKPTVWAIYHNATDAVHLSCGKLLALFSAETLHHMGIHIISFISTSLCWLVRRHSFESHHHWTHRLVTFRNGLSTFTEPSILGTRFHVLGPATAKLFTSKLYLHIPV